MLIARSIVTQPPLLYKADDVIRLPISHIMFLRSSRALLDYLSNSLRVLL